MMNIALYFRSISAATATRFLSRLQELPAKTILCDDLEELHTATREGAESENILVTDQTNPEFLRTLCEESKGMRLLLLAQSMTNIAALPAETLAKILAVVTIPFEESILTHAYSILEKISHNRFATLKELSGLSEQFLSYAVMTPENKAEVLGIISETVKKVGFTKGRPHLELRTARIAEAIDELIINAIFHGNQRFKTLQTSERFSLEKEEAIEVLWSTDDNVLAISVADPYGKLSPVTLLEYLSERRKSTDSSNLRTMGLGLRKVYAEVDTLAVAIHPDRRTEVICLVDLVGIRLGSAEKQPKSLVCQTLNNPLNALPAVETSPHASVEAAVAATAANGSFRNSEGGLSLEVCATKHKLQILGTLNETVKVETLEQALHEASEGFTHRVTVDVSAMTHMNSCGIARWLVTAKRSKVPITYTHVPAWLLEQFFMLEELFENDSLFSSLALPFYCLDEDTVSVKNISIGVEVPLLEDYREFSFEYIDEEGKSHIPHFDTEALLQLLSTHAARWNAILNGKNR